MSLPLDMYGPSFFGRFFNGEATVGVTQQNGTMMIQLLNPRVNGQPLPGWLRSKIPQNIPWDPQANDPNAGALTNVDKIEIKDDQLIIHPKPE
jgi:hypothetical protein